MIILRFPINAYELLFYKFYSIEKKTENPVICSLSVNYIL